MKSSRTVAWTTTAVAALTLSAVAGTAADAATGPTHADYVATIPPGPVHPTATFTNLTKDRVVVVLAGRDISTLAAVTPNELTFSDKRSLLADRGIGLTGINVQNWTGETSELSVSGRILASLPELQDLVAAGGAVTSEGIDHDSLKQMTAGQQWDDTCGTQPSYYESRGLNVQGMYAYSGGPYDATLQADLVSKCFAFGRYYSSTPNTMSKLAAPWKLNAYSLNGGCNTASKSCNGFQTSQRYTTRDQLLRSLTLRPGQLIALQPYSLVLGTAAASARFAWDCSGDPSTHWTSQTEVYCANDFFWALDNMPTLNGVATIPQLAAAVGRAPAQLPGITRAEYVATHPAVK